MAYVGRSDDFDLDDDGILRDSMNGTDLMLDEDGILRDDDEDAPNLDPYKHVARGHWTDSGIGGDKQSSTSTLRQLQGSFEEDLPPIGDESINISEFEASKDELSFDRAEDEGAGVNKKWPAGQRSSLDLMDTLGSTLDKPDQEAQIDEKNGELTDQEGDQQLFTADYYRQLRDLGVLVDGADLSRDSLNEFEEMESRVASRMEGEEEEKEGEEEEGGGTRDLIGEYLESEYQKEKEEQEMEEKERNEAEERERREAEEAAEDYRQERARSGSKHSGESGFGGEEEGGDDGETPRREGYSRASSARTISSRSFPGDEDDFEEEEVGGRRGRRRRREAGYYEDDVDDDDYYYGEDKENMNLSQNLGSQGGSQSQRMMGEDDDEIYNITSRILPSPPSPHRGASGAKIARKGEEGGARSKSGGSTPQRQRSRSRGHSPARGRSGSHGRYNEEANNENYDFDDARSFHSEAGPYQRPTSAASHVSTASELVSRRQKKAEEAALNRLASARSQESFFQQEEGANKSFGSQGSRTPTHKRLLPQPSGGGRGISPGGGSDAANQSFKVKSKTSSGISNAGPLRPTHGGSMSNLEKSSASAAAPQRSRPTSSLGGRSRGNSVSARNDDVDEAASGALTERLTQEAQKRKQATELVQQLQKDYDNLLTKYALAELTIDQMRLDGRVTVHTDSPTPGQAVSGVMSPSVAAVGGASVMSMRQSPAQQAVIMRASPAGPGNASPFLDGASTGDTVDGRPPAVPGDQRSRSRGVGTGTAGSDMLGSTSSLRLGSLGSTSSSLAPGESEDGLREVPENAATVKVELMTHAHALDDRLEAFWGSMSSGQLTLEQQEQTLEAIKGDHDKLRRTYLKAKDDYNILRRSGVVDKVNFDQNKELEGQLFRLGMRFDEVHETVENNLRDRPSQRQPFQPDSNNNKTQENISDASASNQSSDPTAQGRTPSRGTPYMDPAEEAAFERRMVDLRHDYNNNMDAYRKLKYSADSSPEGEKDMDAVVTRLNEICTEMPDMFRLSPEIQARWEKLNKREQEAKNQRRSPVPASPRNRNGVPQSPVDGRPPSINGTSESLRAAFDGSRSSLGSILPDRMDRPPSRGGQGRDRPPSRGHVDRPSSRASNRSNKEGTRSFDPDRPPSRSSMKRDSSYSDRSPRDRASPTPSLPRPRRHAHELRDPKLSKMPDMTLPNRPADPSRRRSRSPSPGGAAGGAVGGNSASALAALPGPGKMKQMTKQRAADDADSGFLGSMVGSGVGVPSLPLGASQQADGQEGERPLRLRHRPDESSTITDNSMDTSSQAVREHRSSGRNRQSSGGSRQDSNRQGHQRPSIEESYDGEEDTLDTVNDSRTSSTRDRDQGPGRRKGHRESSRDLSLDATLEEDDDQSYDSDDISTPRAPRPGMTPPPTAKRRSQGQKLTSEESSSPSKPPRRPGSRTMTASETEEELKAINNSKIRGRDNQQRSDSRQGEKKKDKETVHRTRLKSPPPPARPSSRGSPTTDLLHTRGRHSSGESRRSTASSRRQEATRGERQEAVQTKQELRQTHQGQKVERPSSRQGKQQQQQQKQPPQQQQEATVAPTLPPGLAPASDLARRVKDYEERSAGSSDVEVGSSVTRASSVNSSNRLKALQEEIEKLKEGVAKANEKASRPHPPPQYPQPPPPTYVTAQTQQTEAAAAPANQKPEQPEYYDPFDDPYGFMRMPRRRANSFSGGREREWDEWYWTLPQNRQYDGGDIPLGYAAADAYAENAGQRRTADGGRERNSRESVKERMRQRREERRQRDEAQGVTPGTDVGQQPPPPAGAANDPQTQALYDYYVPPSRYSARGMRSQLASRGYFTTPTGAKIYSSTGEDGDVEDEVDVVDGRRSVDAQHWFGFQQNALGGQQSRPWYQIRRPLRPANSQAGPTWSQGQGQMYAGGRLTQSQEDVRGRTAPPAYYGGYGSTTMVGTASCPMCGSEGTHTHSNYTHIAPTPGTVPHQQGPVVAQTYARDSSPVRRRSRSTGRYRIREYTDLSDSEDERTRRRSRSMSRGRTKPRPRSRRRSSRHYSSDSFSDHSGEGRDIGLDRSLSLSQDISRLTQRMLGTLKGELRKSKSKQREFGSSYW